MTIRPSTIGTAPPLYALHTNLFTVTNAPLRVRNGVPVVVLPAGQSAQPALVVVRVPYLSTAQGH